ncbi:MAG: tyrosine-type recombinase/integrase [Halothiobacillaceae bacterium]
MNEAVEREWVTHNIAREVKLKRNRRDQHEREIPTKEELRTIMSNAPEEHRPLLVTAIFTGMRISELRGLTWENVDFDRRLILVRQRADEFGEMGPPKSRAGRRDIPMTPTVLETLIDWQKRCPKSELGLVFPNRSGNPFNYSNFYNRVFRPLLVANDIVDENGEPRFSIHALRHAAASLFIEQGWTAKKVQVLLGHSSINMTMDVYGHLFANPEEDVEMFEKLEQDLLAA